MWPFCWQTQPYIVLTHNIRTLSIVSVPQLSVWMIQDGRWFLKHDTIHERKKHFLGVGFVARVQGMPRHVKFGSWQTMNLMAQVPKARQVASVSKPIWLMYRIFLILSKPLWSKRFSKISGSWAACGEPAQIGPVWSGSFCSRMMSGKGVWRHKTCLTMLGVAGRA